MPDLDDLIESPNRTPKSVPGLSHVSVPRDPPRPKPGPRDVVISTTCTQAEFERAWQLATRRRGAVVFW